MEKGDAGARRLGWLPGNINAARNDEPAAVTDNAASLPWLKNTSTPARKISEGESGNRLGSAPPAPVVQTASNNPAEKHGVAQKAKSSVLSLHTLTRFPLLFAIIGVIAVGSMAASMPTLAALDFLEQESTPPQTNVDSQAFVVSRTRFDPTSTVTVNGATAVGASAVFTQVVKANFLAEMGDIVTINNIRVENLGSTNTIASLEVIAPSGVSVDVRSPSGAGNELRLLGPNVFALPIDAGSSAQIELRLIILTGPLDPGTSQQFSIQVEVSALD
jgi:hypothetical protein